MYECQFKDVFNTETMWNRLFIKTAPLIDCHHYSSAQLQEQVVLLKQVCIFFIKQSQRINILSMLFRFLFVWSPPVCVLLIVYRQ